MTARKFLLKIKIRRLKQVTINIVNLINNWKGCDVLLFLSS